MKDLYIKVVFGIIAVSLMVIALKLPTGSATAQSIMGVCGTSSNPCYITTKFPLDVQVMQ